MKIRDWLKGAVGVASEFVPGLKPAIGIVNAFLSDDDKLPETATVDQVRDKIEGLPPDVQMKILDNEVAVPLAEIQSEVDRYRIMNEGDQQSTRPKIAWLMAQVLAIEIVSFTLWCFVYPAEMKNPAVWTVFASLTTPLVAILTKYFGDLRKEQGNRRGVPTKSLLQMFKG
jgi:hypothetical protein